MTEEEIKNNMRIGRAVLNFARAVGISDFEAIEKVWQATEYDSPLKQYGIDLTGIDGRKDRFTKIIDALESRFSVTK